MAAAPSLPVMDPRVAAMAAVLDKVAVTAVAVGVRAADTAAVAPREAAMAAVGPRVEASAGVGAGAAAAREGATVEGRVEATGAVGDHRSPSMVVHPTASHPTTTHPHHRAMDSRAHTGREEVFINVLHSLCCAVYVVHFD